MCPFFVTFSLGVLLYNDCWRPNCHSLEHNDVQTGISCSHLPIGQFMQLCEYMHHRSLYRRSTAISDRSGVKMEKKRKGQRFFFFYKAKNVAIIYGRHFKILPYQKRKKELTHAIANVQYVHPVLASIWQKWNRNIEILSKWLELLPFTPSQDHTKWNRVQQINISSD